MDWAKALTPLRRWNMKENENHFDNLGEEEN